MYPVLDWPKPLLQRHDFVKPPQHLLVILQRFHYDPVTQRAKKIMNPVEFAPTLQLPVAEAATNRMTTCEYELYGVLMHSGTSAQHGHYYSYARTSETDVSGSPAEWFCFNDSVVMGSGVVSLLLSPLIFFLSRALVRKYRVAVVERIKQTKLWKAVKATSLYNWYYTYDKLYGA